jgi:hypothetical protein
LLERCTSTVDCSASAVASWHTYSCAANAAAPTASRVTFNEPEGKYVIRASSQP